MAAPNLPSIQAPQSFYDRQSGIIIPGGSTSSSASASRSDPKYMLPDFNKVGRDYGSLQGDIALNGPQQAAVQTQQSLGQQLKGFLADEDTTGRQRIGQGFNQAAAGAVADLNSRGTAPAGLAEQTAQSAVARESGLAVGDLLERLLGREVESEKGVSKSISDLLFGSSEQATDLLNALLGSGGIGNFAQSLSQSASASTNNPS